MTPPKQRATQKRSAGKNCDCMLGYCQFNFQSVVLWCRKEFNEQGLKMQDLDRKFKYCPKCRKRIKK